MAGQAASVSIDFLDVGQGHATLLVDHATSQAMLLDCPPSGVAVVHDALFRHGATLDTGLITHMHSDHASGMVSLLNQLRTPRLKFQPDRVAETSTSKAEKRSILNLLKNGSISLINSSSGAVGRIHWRVIGPGIEVQLFGDIANNRNHYSLCVAIEILPISSAGQIRRLLITGDAPAPSWEHLLKTGADVECDFLLWPHHGGPLGTVADRLSHRVVAATNPSLIVISAGTRNNHGHPARESIVASVGPTRRLVCTEVTGRCHASLTGPTPCGGNVTVAVDDAGGFQVIPDQQSHTRTIMGWSTPQCV